MYIPSDCIKIIFQFYINDDDNVHLETEPPGYKDMLKNETTLKMVDAMKLLSKQAEAYKREAEKYKKYTDTLKDYSIKLFKKIEKPKNF